LLFPSSISEGAAARFIYLEGLLFNITMGIQLRAIE